MAVAVAGIPRSGWQDTSLIFDGWLAVAVLQNRRRARRPQGAQATM